MDELLKKFVHDFLGSDKAMEVISKSINDQVTKSIERCLCDSSSDFRKSLDRSIAKSLQIRDDLALPNYNDMVVAMVQHQVRNALEGAIEKQVAARLKFTLAPVPESIKLSELLDRYRTMLGEKYMHGAFHILQAKFGIKIKKVSGFTIVNLWDSVDSKEKHAPDIAIDILDNKIWKLSFSQATVKDLFSGPFFGFENFLFKCRASVTKIEIDVTDENDIYRDFSGQD
jgi:hypothetical protein